MEPMEQLKIPTFCEHYEPLLVEEISLARHPIAIHYGKCAIIGYIKERSTSLESLMIPGLPENMQLPDGTNQLDLCFDNYRGPRPNNCTVRMYGTIRLRGPDESPLNNSKELVCFLNQLKNDLEQQGNEEHGEIETAVQQAMDAMSGSYVPIMDVQGWEQVQQARELICCNLRLKRINKRLAPQLREMENEIYTR